MPEQCDLAFGTPGGGDGIDTANPFVVCYIGMPDLSSCREPVRRRRQHVVNSLHSGYPCQTASVFSENGRPSTRDGFTILFGTASASRGLVVHSRSLSLFRQLFERVLRAFGIVNPFGRNQTLV